MELLGSINIKVCDPYNGLRPSVEVLPGENDLVAYEANKIPYSVQMRMMTSFKKQGVSNNLRDLVR